MSKKKATPPPTPEDTTPKTIQVTMDAAVIKSIRQDMYVKHMCGGIAVLGEGVVIKIIQAMMKGSGSIHLSMRKPAPKKKRRRK